MIAAPVIGRQRCVGRPAAEGRAENRAGRIRFNAQPEHEYGIRQITAVFLPDCPQNGAFVPQLVPVRCFANRRMIALVNIVTSISAVLRHLWQVERS